MKTELSKIAQDLEQGTITEDKARIILLGLLGVSNSLLCEWCDKPATVHLNGNLACDDHENYC